MSPEGLLNNLEEVYGRFHFTLEQFSEYTDAISQYAEILKINELEGEIKDVASEVVLKKVVDLSADDLQKIIDKKDYKNISEQLSEELADTYSSIFEDVYHSVEDKLRETTYNDEIKNQIRLDTVEAIKGSLREALANKKISEELGDDLSEESEENKKPEEKSPEDEEPKTTDERLSQIESKIDEIVSNVESFEKESDSSFTDIKDLISESDYNQTGTFKSIDRRLSLIEDVIAKMQSDLESNAKTVATETAVQEKEEEEDKKLEEEKESASKIESAIEDNTDQNVESAASMLSEFTSVKGILSSFASKYFQKLPLIVLGILTGFLLIKKALLAFWDWITTPITKILQFFGLADDPNKKKPIKGASALGNTVAEKIEESAAESVEQTQSESSQAQVESVNSNSGVSEVISEPEQEQNASEPEQEQSQDVVPVSPQPEVEENAKDGAKMAVSNTNNVRNYTVLNIKNDNYNVYYS